MRFRSAAKRTFRILLTISEIILEVLEENSYMSLFSLVSIKIIQICVSWKLAKNKLEIKYLDKLVHLDIFGGKIFGCSIQSSIQISVFFTKRFGLSVSNFLNSPKSLTYQKLLSEKSCHFFNLISVKTTKHRQQFTVRKISRQLNDNFNHSKFNYF